MHDGDATLRSLLHRSAHWYPQHEAAVDGTARLTYARLLDRVQRMAKLLHDCGVRKGDRVALLTYPCVSHLIALFGAIELGAIPCALHVRESAATLTAVLRRLSPRVLVYDGALEALATTLRAQIRFITDAVRAVSEATPAEPASPGADPTIPADLDRYTLDFEPMPIAADDVAVIILSSGTTGIPKGVMHTHRTQTASASAGAHMVGARPGSAIVNASSTAFVGWYNCTLPFLGAAGKVAFQAHWDPREFLRRLQDERATFAFLVPTMWRMLLAQGVERYDLSTLECAAYAGEAMDATTLARLRERICRRVLNVYGATETGAWAGGTAMPIVDPAGETRLGSVGKPLAGSDLRIVRPGGTAQDVLPWGEEGEILIRGASVSGAIWDQPQVARARMEGPWWHSGDLGALDAEGFLYLHGRVDDMIISGGINILPNEIEEALRSHPAVADCAVVGVPDERWGQRVVGFIVARNVVTAEALDTHLQGSGVSSYKHPRDYRFVTELPRGNTGKVARSALRERIRAGFDVP
jgi:acyl-CoA synthetase (AMP-forming)/AMP-acid ligase II